MSQHDHNTDQPSPGIRQAAPAVPDLRSPDDLHICPDCDSPLVYPVDWAPVDMRHWRVELNCPECGWERAGLYEQDVLDRFDAILDAGTESLLDDLRLLQRANMEDELNRFVTALDRDLITPEDF
jgi:hypothetical protein